MKRVLFCAIFLLAGSLLAKDAGVNRYSPVESFLVNSSKKIPGPKDYTPITDFPTGQYLGLGHYITASDQSGTYSSLATVNWNTWKVDYVREYGVGAFSLSFDFSDNGFFTVALTEHTALGDISHEGHGYCQSVQCHISANLGDRLFEETVTFATWEKKIFRVGSLSSPDVAGAPGLIMAWEEMMVRVGGEDDEDDGAGEDGNKR